LSAAAAAGAIVRAPAKINLILRVAPPRPDGYHPVLSLMARVGIADTLALRPAPDIRVSCAALPAGDTLVTRALALLCDAAGHDGGFHVRIDKRIPVGAGLGGGSSDAAAALAAANDLLGAPMTPRDLLDIAGAIGSDVAFFLGPAAQIAEGRGERCRPAPPLPPAAVAIAQPADPLATGDVYAAYRGVEHLPAALPVARTLAELAAVIENDLQPVVDRLVPGCRLLREGLLDRGALAAAVSGSGSAVFGLFATDEAARDAIVELPGAAWTTATRLAVTTP